eukprot:8127206-Alexandrium_andersonii.AAC.1
MPKLAQTRSPELSRDPFCAIFRAESDSGTGMERFPRSRNDQNTLNKAKQLGQLEQFGAM